MQIDGPLCISPAVDPKLAVLQDDRTELIRRASSLLYYHGEQVSWTSGEEVRDGIIIYSS